MQFFRLMCVKLSELKRGQTMTEYALILAAIAVAVFATYKTVGGDISSFIQNQVEPTLG